jgi:hypothetical protein
MLVRTYERITIGALVVVVISFASTFVGDIIGSATTMVAAVTGYMLASVVAIFCASMARLKRNRGET